MIPQLIIQSDLTHSDCRIQKARIHENSQKWLDDKGDALAYGFSRQGYNYLYIINTALFQFTEDQKNVVAFTFGHTSRELIYDIYYRNVLPLILQMNGKEVIHASAVKTGDQITVFCAKSGTGKSTLAYGLAKRGYELCADDAVAIEIIKHTILAVPLPFRIRLLPDSRTFFSNSRNSNVNPPSVVKRSFQIKDKLPLKSICFVNKVEETFEHNKTNFVEKQYPTNGFSDLLSHAYVYQMKDLRIKRRMMENYLDIANNIPLYRINYPHNFELFSSVLDKIEEII